MLIQNAPDWINREISHQHLFCANELIWINRARNRRQQFTNKAIHGNLLFRLVRC